MVDIETLLNVEAGDEKEVGIIVVFLTVPGHSHSILPLL